MNCHTICRSIQRQFVPALYRLYSYCGLFQSGLKILFGATILYLMKRSLNKYFHERKWSIVLVVIGTVFIFGFKFLFNLVIDLNDLDFTTIFNFKHIDGRTLSIGRVVLSFLISSLNLGLELLLIKANIDNINYKNDVHVARKS